MDETTLMQMRVIALENNVTALTNDIHKRLETLEAIVKDHAGLIVNDETRIKALEDARKIQIGLNTQFQAENKRSIFNRFIGK